MNEVDLNLVRQITQRVIESMGQRGDQASLQPAIGVCTGDYAQFTDRPDLSAAQESRPMLTGIITARQLQDAIDAASDGVAVLDPNARLTPLAQDMARDKPEHIHRDETAKISQRYHGTPKNYPSSMNATQWRWWADDYCSDVIKTVNSFGNQLIPASAPRTDAGLMEAVRDVANGVDRRTITGGVLFVRSAAKAGLLANRCDALRAAVAGCPESVDQAIEAIGVNVLIVEYPYHPLEVLRQILERLVNRQSEGPGVPGALRRQLNELNHR